MTILKTRIANLFTVIIVFFMAVSPNVAIAQNGNLQSQPTTIGNTQPPSSSSGIGGNNNTPFNNTSNGGSSNGTMNANASGPGGPVDPPPDVNVPIDGGITILLSLGLVHGYLISKRKRNKQTLVGYATR